ncbi:MAG: hypothetical protein JNN04_14045, partial [Cyclobacteriaceae bacterium]|nr:hypothetical protein [Cyclobacteriaceae bacterium]
MRKILGWLFLAILTSLISFWAFWGIVESFYEGWYFTSFIDNCWLTVSRYLLPVWILLIPGTISIHYKKIGTIIFIVLGITIAYYFSQWFFFIPLFAIAGLGWASELPSKKISLLMVLGLPIVTLIVSGAQPAYRVATRYNANISEPFTTLVNKQKLNWAPPGPGWPSAATNWNEANEICLHLSPDGQYVSDTIVGLWRLPTVEEIVVSTHYHGKPMPGTWYPESKKTQFKITPDKEPPLWNSHSPIIYWWTANASKDSALMYSFNGVVFTQEKHHKAGYYGFRAVRL